MASTVSLALLALGIACTLGGPVIQLRAALADHVERQSAVDETVYRYDPGLDEPYWLVFWPQEPLSVGGLEAAGLPAPVAERVVADLAYLRSDGHLLILVPLDGRLMFTGAEGIAIDRAVAAEAEGAMEIRLERRRGAWVPVAITADR